MSTASILILALIQGAAELLPVSSSAHVIVAERLLGLDPSSPEMTFLLVMLHTGTMFAVLLFFWKRWKLWFLKSAGLRRQLIIGIGLATLATGAVGYPLKIAIERLILKGGSKAEIEELFSNLPLIATALALVGILILISAKLEERRRQNLNPGSSLSARDALWIGAVQGICLPFRGFSRSGATISTGLIRGISRVTCEEFSFLLAVVLTPPVILRELLRLLKARKLVESVGAAPLHLSSLLAPGIMGMIFSFATGLMALRLLSRWLEAGKWRYFGYYCLAAACGVLAVNQWM